MPAVTFSGLSLSHATSIPYTGYQGSFQIFDKKKKNRQKKKKCCLWLTGDLRWSTLKCRGHVFKALGAWSRAANYYTRGELVWRAHNRVGPSLCGMRVSTWSVSMCCVSLFTNEPPRNIRRRQGNGFFRIQDAGKRKALV